MARPRGHRLNTEAFQDVIKWRGLSLTEVADRAEIPRPSVSSLLGGFNRASVPTCHRLAAALDCNVRTLFPTFSESFEEVA